MTRTFKSELDAIDVDNVFIYVGDAVRWDALPEEVASRGTVLKSVAASIHSPTSFASLVTGRYLPSHGVSEFSRHIPDSMNGLFDIEDHHTRFTNTIGVAGTDDPIFSVLNVPSNELSDPFEGLSEPFVCMERSQGGHAPYGGFGGTAREYFAERSDATLERLRNEYRLGVERDAADFGRRIAALDREGRLDDTLVIYTSDHGELLGEGGMFGHNGPIRPEHVYVPTVFVHPEIDVRRSEMLFRHIDLLPTVLDVLGTAMDGWQFDGRSLRDSQRSEYGCSFYRKEHTLNRFPVSPTSSYESVWDTDGGQVFSRSPLPERLVGLFGQTLQGVQRTFVRRCLRKTFNSYISNETTYGKPNVSVSEAATLLKRVQEQSDANEGSTAELSSDAREHLRDMGYLE
ncbi:MAG TPA: sulfatase-like hydrolase/transferase [Halococcus sp.]|nr:sulfatase-like hydrolase/transferase [Halococcus sp.]